MRFKVLKITTNRKTRTFIMTALFVVSGLFFGISSVGAASLSLDPSGGDFSVDSTFNVSVFVNTGGESINAVKLNMTFPANKLQLASPSTGKSIIEVWAAQPRFNNQHGTIEFQGGIPDGINTSKGLITTLTFRVKEIGSAIIKITDSSKVLKNDGDGTDILGGHNNGVYDLRLPPPSGPVVTSETHPDQSRFHSRSTVILKWESDEKDSLQGYSFVLNDEAISIPDDIVNGEKTQASYQNQADGKYYFHIKALRDGVWGGTTHFAVSIDTTPPADFPIEVLPSKKTSKRQPIFEFLTTDSISGIDHYELKIIALNEKNKNDPNKENESFFIETVSPYISSELELGSYDIIVRAYDKAGNFTEIIEQFSIFQPFLGTSIAGLQLGETFVLSWFWLLLLLLLIILLLILMVYYLRKEHRYVDKKRKKKEFPGHVEKQLKELKQYQNKYGKLAKVLVLAISFGLFFVSSSLAQETKETKDVQEDQEIQNMKLNPPMVTTVSKNISNEEIFYVGGQVDIHDSDIDIYLQSMSTGEMSSFNVGADNRGDWFYRHNTFLPSGEYVLWTQAKLEDGMSPPSSQVQIHVKKTAFQVGSSRISQETIYLAIVGLMVVIVLALITHIIFRKRRLKVKEKKLRKEVREAEEAVRRGFAVLQRDLQAELEAVRKARVTGQFSPEAELLERKLIEDMDRIERNIGKEVVDIEKLQNNFT